MRYLPLTEAEREKILHLCQAKSFEELTQQVPEDLRLRTLLDLEPQLSEWELSRHLGELAEKNVAASYQSHLGQGVYDHTWPVVIDQIINRGEYLTAYTPYQPELSQGTLQVIFEFQSMIADLMGLEVSNASLYDGSTALLEGILMAARLQGHSEGIVYVSEGLYPRTRDILETYLTPLGIQLKTWSADPKTFRSYAQTLLSETSQQPVLGVVLQSPNQWGLIEDWSEAAKVAQQLKTQSLAFVPHMHQLALFASPGEKGIDIATGEGQALGIPVGFGGPYLGLLACRKKDVRQMPGRLVGLTQDARGDRAFCVTLSTREQHIRRERATSNICSNQNLMATRATLYMTLMGPSGLRQVAQISRSKTLYARESLRKTLRDQGSTIQVLDGECFNEITLLCPPTHPLWTDATLARAQETKILAGLKVSVPKSSAYVSGLCIAFTEKHTRAQIDQLIQVLSTSETPRKSS